MQKTLSDSRISGLDRLLNFLGMSPLAILGIFLLVIAPLVPPFNQEYMIRWMVTAGFIAAASIAFDFTVGFINIVNFGFYAILGLGGYTSAIIVTNLGLPVWTGFIFAALSAGILGFLLGLLTLRLRGVFAAVMAWFVGLALMGLATKLVWLTRGPAGFRSPLLFSTSSNAPYYYLIIITMLLIYLLTHRVIHSHYGLAFKAIGQNMDAARTSGINPTYYRIVNFTISCTMAGWLGGFYAHYYGILTPDIMQTAKTVEVLAVAYIGGRGSLWGGAVVAFPFIIAMELVRSSLSNLPGLNLIIYGMLLVVVMIYYPGGVANFFKTYFSGMKNGVLKYFITGPETVK